MDSQLENQPFHSNAGIPHRKPVGESPHPPALQTPNLTTSSTQQPILITDNTSHNTRTISLRQPTSQLPPGWEPSYAPDGRAYYTNSLQYASSGTCPPQNEQNQELDNWEQRAIQNWSPEPEAPRATTDLLSSLSPVDDSPEWEHCPPLPPRPSYPTRRQTFPSSISESSQGITHQLKSGLDIGIKGTKKAIELGKGGTTVVLKTAKEHRTAVRAVLNIINCFLVAFTGWSFGGAKVLGHTLDDKKTDPQRKQRGENNVREVVGMQRQSEERGLRGGEASFQATKAELGTARQERPARRASSGSAPGTYPARPVKRVSGIPSSIPNTTNIHFSNGRGKAVQKNTSTAPEPAVERNQPTIDSWLLKQDTQATHPSISPPPAQKTTRTQSVSHIVHSESPPKTNVPLRRHSAIGTGVTADPRIPTASMPASTTLAADHTNLTSRPHIAKPSQPVSDHPQPIKRLTNAVHSEGLPQKAASVWSKIGDPVKSSAKKAFVGAIKSEVQTEISSIVNGGSQTPAAHPTNTTTNNGNNYNNNTVDYPNNGPSQSINTANTAGTYHQVGNYSQPGPYSQPLYLPQQPVPNAVYGDNSFPNIQAMPEVYNEVDNIDNFSPNMEPTPGVSNEVGDTENIFPDIEPIPEVYDDIDNTDGSLPNIAPIPQVYNDVTNTDSAFDNDENALTADPNAYSEGEDEQDLATEDAELNGIEANLAKEDDIESSQEDSDNELDIPDPQGDLDSITDPGVVSDEGEDSNDGADDNVDIDSGDFDGDDDQYGTY